MYANTAPQTDTVVRPNIMGATTIEVIRGEDAPDSFTWQVGLQPGQQLEELPNGAVAVTDPTAPPATDSNADLPPPAPNAQGPEGLTDVATQFADANYQIAKAEQLTGEAVVAVIAPPWVRDAAGQSIPATLTVNINQITLTIVPWTAPEPLPPPEYRSSGCSQSWPARRVPTRRRGSTQTRTRVPARGTGSIRPAPYSPARSQT